MQDGALAPFSVFREEKRREGITTESAAVRTERTRR
jgi:hypothetical protein